MNNGSSPLFLKSGEEPNYLVKRLIFNYLIPN